MYDIYLKSECKFSEKICIGKSMIINGLENAKDDYTECSVFKSETGEQVGEFNISNSILRSATQIKLGKILANP